MRGFPSFLNTDSYVALVGTIKKGKSSLIPLSLAHTPLESMASVCFLYLLIFLIFYESLKRNEKKQTLRQNRSRSSLSQTMTDTGEPQCILQREQSK